MLRKPLLTTQEVAQLLKVKEATVRGWIRHGELKGIHISREWRVAMKDLEEFVAAGTQTAKDEDYPAEDGVTGQHPDGPRYPRGSKEPRPNENAPTSLPRRVLEQQSCETSMTALDLLIHIKGPRKLTESVDVGLRLARQLGARAHGLLTLGDAARFKALFSGDRKLIAERQVEWDKTAAEIEGCFLDALKANGVEGHWLVGEGQASELLSLVGRVNDLVVVEQNEAGVDEIDWDPAEETALGGGTPTLVVPNKGDYPNVGRRIAVAWNQSREAALAVHGALPLLQRAERVIVLKGQRKETFASITRMPFHDLGSHLRRKGVSVEEVPLSASDDTAGAALLKAAHQHNADMMVMGAYGRSWFREWVLGGVTRHVLRNMDLPVLMAH